MSFWFRVTSESFPEKQRLALGTYHLLPPSEAPVPLGLVNGLVRHIHCLPLFAPLCSYTVNTPVG